jgi:hypothetical protein
VLEAGQAWGQFETGKRRRLIGTRHGRGTAAPTGASPTTRTAAGVVRMMTATGVMPAASAASTT